jgi:hypothetical protein
MKLSTLKLLQSFPGSIVSRSLILAETTCELPAKAEDVPGAENFACYVLGVRDPVHGYFQRRAEDGSLFTLRVEPDEHAAPEKGPVPLEEAWHVLLSLVGGRAEDVTISEELGGPPYCKAILKVDGSTFDLFLSPPARSLPPRTEPNRGRG